MEQDDEFNHFDTYMYMCSCRLLVCNPPSHITLCKLKVQQMLCISQLEQFFKPQTTEHRQTQGL